MFDSTNREMLTLKWLPNLLITLTEGITVKGGNFVVNLCFQVFLEVISVYQILIKIRPFLWVLYEVTQSPLYREK